MILMYHHVAPPETIPADPDPAEGWWLNHSPEGFARQIREFRRRGYRLASLPEGVGTIRETGVEPPKTLYLTFDDGWIDNYRYAVPILAREGITATFFVTTEHLRRGADDTRKMGAGELRGLVEAGMTVGGHTRTHPVLTELSEAEATAEVAGCKSDLEDLLGQAVELFAYPGGMFDARTARIVREAGFAAACSVLGPARNDRSSIYWLFRDLVTEGMNTLGDRYRLSPLARRLLSFRVARRLAGRLRGD